MKKPIMKVMNPTTASSGTLQKINHHNDWPQPVPVVEKSTSAPYPTDALPAVVQKAVSSYHHYGQQPLPLIASSALANISLACQANANVARDHCLVSPVSLYFLTAGMSGERKSAADSVFSDASRTWENTFRQQRAPAVSAARALHHAWSMEKEGLLSQIKRTMITGDDNHELTSRLSRLMRQEPDIPLQPELYFEDATQEALASELSSGWPSASLWSDEAGIVLGNHSMQGSPIRFVALLNRLWDGKPFTAHRKTSNNYTLEHRRLTLNLMMQPILLQKLAHQASGIGRQSGFLARCLLAHPESAMGSRFYQEPPSSREYMADFEKHLTACLDQSRKLTHLGCYPLPVLQFSREAKQQWILFFNHLEAGLKQEGQWTDVKDFASKTAENAARLAALFHLFAGAAGDISALHTEQAIQIVHWHLQEARRLLAPVPATLIHQDAKKLMSWLLSRGVQQITPRAILQSSTLRDKSRRDPALNLLMEHHWIRIKNEQGKTLVAVNPQAAAAWR